MALCNASLIYRHNGLSSNGLRAIAIGNGVLSPTERGYGISEITGDKSENHKFATYLKLFLKRVFYYLIDLLNFKRLPTNFEWRVQTISLR